jgi:indolepyruvate ferredoxin oxidoreductase
MPLTRTFAQALLKLMAYKDEYEVARLYTDGAFRQSLQQQFEGDVRLEFYMAPPAISKPREGQAPRKVRLGPWMMPALKVLAHGKRLRGTAFDFFGKTEERKMERALIEDYLARIDALLPSLSAEKLKAAVELAALPLTMRGYGHVKLANVALARVREAELLHRFDPKKYPRPQGKPAAGQIRGIRVTAGV